MIKLLDNETTIKFLNDGQPQTYLHVITTSSTCYFTKRPHYCDRGRYLLYIDSHCDICLPLDGSDGFPRYYFLTECMFREFEAWCQARSQKVISINFNEAPKRTAHKCDGKSG